MSSRKSQAAYRRAQAERGLVELAVWIPAEHKAVVKALADTLREKKMGTDDDFSLSEINAMIEVGNLESLFGPAELASLRALATKP